MDKLQEIKELVQHGRDTFIGYVTHHKAKGHTEKAESNKEHAYKLQLAMTIIDELIEESKWQPIETAPKGEDLLVFSEIYICIASHSKNTGKWWSEYGHQLKQPTHWKPLPQPPKTRRVV